MRLLFFVAVYASVFALGRYSGDLLKSGLSAEARQERPHG